MIRLLIKIYIIIIIVDAILSFFPDIKRQPWAQKLRQLADYSLRPVRRFMPQDTPFDFSPLVVILILNVLMLLW